MASEKDDKQQIGLTPEANDSIAAIAAEHFGVASRMRIGSPSPTRSGAPQSGRRATGWLHHQVQCVRHAGNRHEHS